MASSSSPKEIIKEFPFFRVYNDGCLEFFRPPSVKILPFDDPISGVRSKDVVISSQPTVSARIFIPKVTNPDKQKFPLLLYMHGGGFCTFSAFPRPYHDFCNTFSSQANAIVVSVEYGLFPDRPIPACYEDSWAALKWVASHVSGNGPDPWLNHHADLGRVFIGGDSAGGNIAHTLAFRVGSIGLPGVNLVGVTMVHPFFGGTEDDEMWLYMCANNDGPQDPRMKPPAEDLARLGGERVLIFVAERDYLCPAGKNYYEELKKSGWKGRVELVEHLDEKHVFYLRNPTCTNALELTNKFISFIKQNNGSLRNSIESKY
ncbi:putative carboxylesterase 12 [Citrus sinensis]|uniref:2-hydroxyisoflavanone dehydratase-like n=1 Tax=Citrus sinensis TaxID=2711 RepID=UPI002197FB8D|nr:2-hydroxyisoflavanone dehydratase-like [Citrus sinensis]XP_052287821.1 2-hydroxyisoflavanone dehydratase-like [Citrus sinensis]KAH9656164.1 putative carboxylesterase 12 [Citrus sinensis]